MDRMDEIQSVARKIAEFAAKRPRVSDFIGDVQKFSFDLMVSIKPTLLRPRVISGGGIALTEDLWDAKKSKK